MKCPACPWLKAMGCCMGCPMQAMGCPMGCPMGCKGMGWPTNCRAMACGAYANMADHFGPLVRAASSRDFKSKGAKATSGRTSSANEPEIALAKASGALTSISLPPQAFGQEFKVTSSRFSDPGPRAGPRKTRPRTLCHRPFSSHELLQADHSVHGRPLRNAPLQIATCLSRSPRQPPCHPKPSHINGIYGYERHT